jgi:uncharacterized protein
MKPKVSLITLGVADVERSRDFYLALGFKIRGEDNGVHIMFEMEGSMLSIFPRDKSAEGAGVPDDGSGFGGVVFAHNEPSKEAVDKVMDEARACGAVITKEAADEFWGGYAGYFKDPDGYVWSVAWNPFDDLT